jgi:hypothetical protein
MDFLPRLTLMAEGSAKERSLQKLLVRGLSRLDIVIKKRIKFG